MTTEAGDIYLIEAVHAAMNPRGARSSSVTRAAC
jgi:hypothetical protein